MKKISLVFIIINLILFAINILTRQLNVACVNIIGLAIWTAAYKNSEQ